MDYRNFLQPDSILRPAPFWALNDRLAPEETARQLADMTEVGLSGAFFHSRSGLITDYLSDEWFAAARSALQAAKEHDGYLWLYDEDLWPSGGVGGLIAAMKDEYRGASLHAVLLAPGENPPELAEAEPRAAYLIQRDGMVLQSAEQVPYEEALDRDDMERLLFYRQYAGKSGWFGGQSDINRLNPEVTKLFLEMTHEVYAKELGEEFGKRIPGMFTDEPHIEPWFECAFAWYDGIPDRYQEWHGRDFWADLPYCVLDGPECRKIRLLVHRTFLQQFTESFSKPVYDWCDTHNLVFTGHYLNEDNVQVQIRTHCGGVMAHYRYQHIPGVDHLCRQTDYMLLTMKQVGSAARQLGRKQVLTEIFGVSRHTNTFEDFKWIGNFNLVFGATFFCPHLSLYSALGRRKRDYPPNWNYQQTYWKELRPLNDYFTRLGYALTAGKAQVEVLVLHPVEDATAGHRAHLTSSRRLPSGEDFAAARRDEEALRRIINSLINAGYDCDLGDEGYLADMGAVNGNRFQVGEMSYGVVVVPPATTWRPSTFALLQQFAANGGKIIFVGETPTELDGDPADAWKALLTQSMTVPNSTVQIMEAVAKTATIPFTLRDTEGRVTANTLLQHRADGAQQTLFLVNNDRNHAQSYSLTWHGAAGTPLAIWNPVDGVRVQATTQAMGDDLRYTFTLPPVGSLLLVLGPGATDGAAPAAEWPDLTHGSIQPLPSTWDFTRSEENVQLMDRISASPDGGQTWWNEDLEFRVRKRLAAHFGTSDALAWQPWVAVRRGLFDGKGGEVVLRYRFQSAINQPKRAFLVMENLKKGAVTVNGTPVDLANAGWQWDHDFGKVEITPLVRKGENIVDFRIQYDFLTEVEPAYIVGDFGVRLRTPYEGEIIDEPAQLHNGSWLEQGYPFYSGCMTYRTTIQGTGQRTFLRLQRASGILYKVRLNGAELGSILWRPHVLELTSGLKEGGNTLEIEVISSRQNTMGPLHEKDGDNNDWVGPGAFEDENSVREEFSLFDYGLLGGAELVTIV